MTNFLSAYEMIQSSLGLYRNAKLLYTEGKNVKEIYQKLTTINIESRKELIEGFLASQIDYKDHIKIQGKLIDYAHLYKPKSYINSIEENLMGEQKNDDDKGKELIFSASWKPFQFPISKIPSVPTNDGNMSLSFIYPLEFKSFIYEGENAFVGGPLSNPTFKIPESAKPIPILLNKEDAVKYQYQNVEIVGKVIPLPDQLVRKLIENPFSAMAFSEIVTPLNAKMPSLCLTLNSNKGQIKKVNSGNQLNECKASIFMETHIEGQASDKLVLKIPDLVSKSLLGKDNQYSQYTDVMEKEPSIFQLSTDTNVKVIGKNPNVLGFYFEGNLINLEADYNMFAKEFNQFTKNLQDRVPAFTMNIDFMHDYNLSSYIDAPLLNSKSSAAIQDKELQDTMDWLKNE